MTYIPFVIDLLYKGGLRLRPLHSSLSLSLSLFHFSSTSTPTHFSRPLTPSSLSTRLYPFTILLPSSCYFFPFSILPSLLVHYLSYHTHRPLPFSCPVLPSSFNRSNPIEQTLCCNTSNTNKN